jgi:hypothetical protein
VRRLAKGGATISTDGRRIAECREPDVRVAHRIHGQNAAVLLSRKYVFASLAWPGVACFILALKAEYAKSASGGKLNSSLRMVVVVVGCSVVGGNFWEFWP